MTRQVAITPELLIRAHPRFWAKVARVDDGESCWLWTASRTLNGYGQFRVGGKAGRFFGAHRVAWLLEHGEWPSERLRHVCGVKLCVRLSHLAEGLDLPERSAAEIAATFWAQVEKSDSCWLWLGGRDEDGYGRATIGRRRTVLAHRAAWELANGPIPEGMCVLHRCDNPPCVRAEPNGAGHLFVGDRGDNARDMAAKGRSFLQRHPERALRGDDHWARRHPEKVKRGDQHWRRRRRKDGDGNPADLAGSD